MPDACPPDIAILKDRFLKKKKKKNVPKIDYHSWWGVQKLQDKYQNTTLSIQCSFIQSS